MRNASRGLPRLHRQDHRPMAVRAGPVHRRRHPAAGRHRRQQRHRPVRRLRRRPDQTARHQNASALRLPQGRRALRRVLLDPLERSGLPLVAQRRPPIRARPLEGVDESGGGERSEGANAPSSLPPRHLSGICDGEPPDIGVRRFGSLRDGAHYGAFCSNLRNDPANRRWNNGGRQSGKTIIASQLPSAARERASRGNLSRKSNQARDR